MSKSKISFKTKVLIPILAIFILSVLIIAVINYRLLGSSVKAKNDANLDIFTEGIFMNANHLDLILSNTKQMLNVKHLATAKAVMRILDSSITGTLTSEVLQNITEPLDIIEINVVDVNGIVIYSSIPKFIGFDYKLKETTRSYMDLASKHILEITEDPRQAMQENGSFGIVTHYVGIAGGPSKGFVQVGFNANEIGKLYEEINITKAIKKAKIGENGYGMVLSDGKIYSHPNENMQGRDVVGEAWYQAISRGSGYEWIDMDGKKYYVSYKNANGNTIVGLVPKSDYYKELNKSLAITVVLILIAITVIIAITYMFLGKMLRPIKHLVHGLEKIAAGDLDARIEGNFNDEFDEIKDSVNKMAKDIKTNLADKLAAERTAYEEASNAKNQFLTTMSHEIRTPMNVVIGVTQMLLQKEDMPDEYADAFEKIYNSGKSMLRIINDILGLSKIEMGKLELYPVEYDMPGLINDVMQLNTMRTRSKQIEFKLDIDENLPSKLYGDGLRLKQILSNLLSNAFKYTEKGFVKLSVSSTAKDDDVTLNFTVEDTGQGIKPEDKKQLFYHVTDGANRGLGTTKLLVDIMDGTIDVKSQIGKGSIFIVTVKQKAVECMPIGMETMRNLRNFTYTKDVKKEQLKLVHSIMSLVNILIVDDLETNLYVAKGLLSPYKLNIDTVCSGQEAIKKIENGKTYDIIFMDHMMPEMDGIEATKHIRDLGYGLPIVALTANVISGMKEMFLSNGFNDFLPKPVDQAKLNAILEKWIPKEKQKDFFSEFSIASTD
ncbi:MAG: response regulator [Fibromonadales bacterium]|nr:response regulator [Fibromonadales bacterium]